MQPLKTGTRIDIGFEMMEQRRESIRRAYFVDQLILDQGGPQKTATEILDRRDTRLALLGPQITRLRAEYLNKLIIRVFGLLSRRGELPPAPEVIQGKDFDIEYVSPLANTQRAEELTSLNRALESRAALIQLDPTLLDNVDADRALRDALMISGVPHTVIRRKDEVQQIRDERAQAQQQQQQLEQAAMVADSAAKLGVTVDEG
jgi:hypothetical protein